MEKIDFTAEVRITDSCNFRCSYCSQSDKNNHFMALDTLETIISNFFSYNEKLMHFIWIGGEALLHKDDFFKQIIEFEKKYNFKKLKVSNSIQTNSFLADKSRLATLRNLGFKIGFSYDGLDKIQDKYRKNCFGKSTSQKVTTNLKNSLKDINQKQGVISVITKDFLNNEEDIYNNLKNYATVFSFNMCTPVGECAKYTNQQEIMPTKDEMTKIILSLYECWKKDPEKKEVRPFSEIIDSMLSGMNTCCEYSAVNCYKILGVDYDGKIYSCIRTTSIPETCLGDLKTESIDKILQNPILNLPLVRYNKLKDICDCEYFTICNGGCLAESLEFNKDLISKTYYCEAKKALFSKIKEDLENGTLQ